jgi:hypothetical protein
MCVFFWCMMVPVMLQLAAILFILHQTFLLKPHYSVAIQSVSGLTGRPALAPEFNLTIRVASHGFWIGQCAEPAMAVDVSYGGVSLASAITTAEKFCAGPRKAADQSVVARGVVVLPASLLDGLTVDMINGVQVFDVALHGWVEKESWACGPRWVRDKSALQTECPKSSRSSGHAWSS